MHPTSRRLGLEVLLVASLTDTGMQTTPGHKAQGQPVKCFDLHSPNVPHTEIMNIINDHALVDRTDNYSKSSLLCNTKQFITEMFVVVVGLFRVKRSGGL